MAVKKKKNYNKTKSNKKNNYNKSKNTVKKNQQGGLFEAFKCGGKKRITKKCAKGQPVELDKCGKKMKKKQAGGTMDYSWLRHQSNQ